MFLREGVKSRDSSRRTTASAAILIFSVGTIAAAARAQEALPELHLHTGKEIYQAACVACHGPDGKGMPETIVGFEKPKSFPDFSRCDQTTPELNVDYKATILYGGHARGFSAIMPAFGEVLSSPQIDEVVKYLRGFCEEKGWPRGAFNLPLPQVTEKAYPEDEVVITSSANVRGAPGVNTDIIYEQRFGQKNQVEVDVPIDFNRQAPGLWYGGIGDATIGVKRVAFANLNAGSILSGFGGIILPSGNTGHGLGSGVTEFETFAAFAQLLPGRSFVQLQAGTDQPTDTSKAPRSVFWRSAIGKSFEQSGLYGRLWSPMMEFLANRDFTAHPETDWDIVPEVQVTLSQRQHIRANLGLRIPVTHTAGRPTEAVFYVLWDWQDGGLKAGW